MAENKERTFIMVKPDGVQRGLVGKIIQRFEEKGFKLVAMKMLWVSGSSHAIARCTVVLYISTEIDSRIRHMVLRDFFFQAIFATLDSEFKLLIPISTNITCNWT